MNPDELDIVNWKCRGQPMTINTVLAWARVWNVSINNDTIPYIDWTEYAKNADIRVIVSGKLSLSVSKVYNNGKPFVI